MAEMPIVMAIKIEGWKPDRSRSTRSTSQHSDRSSSRGSTTSTGSRKAAKKIVIKGEADEHEASCGRSVAAAGTSATTVAQILRTYCPTYHYLPTVTEASEAALPPNFEDASFLDASETLLSSKTAQVPVMLEPLPKHYVSHSVLLHSSGGTAAHVVGTTHGVLVYRPFATTKVDGRLSEQHTIADGKELELLPWALQETRDDPAYHDVELLCALPRIADASRCGVLADGSKPPPKAHLNYFAFSSSKSPSACNDRSPGRGRVALGAPHENPMWCVSASSISSQFLVSHSLHRTRRIVSVCMQSVFLPFSFAAANSSRSSHIPLVVSIDEEGGVCLLDVARETSCVVVSSVVVDDDSSKCLEDMFSSKSRSTAATPSPSERIVDVDVHASIWQSTPEKRKEMTTQDALPLFHFLGKGGKLLRIESVLIGPCTEACSECIEHSSKLLSEGWVPLYLILSLSMGSSSPQVTEEARGSSVTGQQLQVIRVELRYFARGVAPRAVIASVEILESVSITPPATASRRGLAIPSTVLAVSDLGRSFMDESLNLSASFLVAAPRQRLLCYRACSARVVASYAFPTFGTGLGAEQHSSNCSSAACVYVSHLISVGELSLPKMGCAASSEDTRRKFERCIVCETSSGVLLLASLPPIAGSDLPAIADHPVIDAHRDELLGSDDCVSRSEKAALDAWLDSVDSDNDELHTMESLDSVPHTKPSIPHTTKAFQAEIVFAAKPTEYGSPMHHQPDVNGGDVGTYASTSTVRKDVPMTVLRVLCYDESAVAQYSRNPSRAMTLCNLAKSTTPRVVLLFTDAQACVVSLGPMLLAADTKPMGEDRVKESSASPTHEDSTVAVEWKTLKAQGTPGSLMHMLTSVAHNVQIPVVRTNVTSLSPSGHAPSGSRFFASLLFGSAPALSDVVPIVTPDPPAPQLVATPHVGSDHDSSSQSSRSSRRSSSGRTWRRSNKSVRQHLSSVEATISADYEAKAILEPIEMSAPERIALDIFELMEKQKHQVEARDEPEFRNQIINDEAARWLTLYTDLDGAYAKAAAKDARHRRTFVTVSSVVASASSYVDVFPLRSSAYEAENIITASARFMRLWRQRRTASTSRAASSRAVDQVPLRHQEWLAEYFLRAKLGEGGHSNDEVRPSWLLELQDFDRCQFEVLDLECRHAAQLDSINETDDVVVAENQRAIRLEGGGVQWEPLPSCPFQYLAGGGHADIAALNAQGSTQRRGDGAWRWEKEASTSQLSGRLDSSSAVLNGWTVRVDWRYATQWPTIEPGDDEHWALAADDPGAVVRRRVL